MPDPLPVDAAIPEILAHLGARRSLVLVAPPGTGKTTRVPPAIVGSGLLSKSHPNLVLLQPRRVAARAVAARIGAENGWAIGEEVGYQVRFERKIGPRTRLRVVTEGILNRQIVGDPFLEGVGAVVLDEFHERSIHSDLALALLKEVRDSIRNDLILVVMSATLDAGPVSEFLGDAPVVRVEGRTFPVTIAYAGSSREPLPDRMARAIEAEVAASPDGDLLAFLPGVEEIRRTARSIAAMADRDGLIVLPLHGSLPPEEQDRAIRPNARRKIVLATNIAETSLTIDGVTTVIDGGLARQASFDAGRGIDRLELTRISRASAAQRAGRAGRTRPGRCVRLWSEREERGMAATDRPEIHRVDLAPTVLALLSWGQADPSAFGWFEPPEAGRVVAAMATLVGLGAVDEGSGRVGEIGRRLLDIPAPPRLGRLLLEAHREGRTRDGATLAALLAERDIVTRGPGRAARPSHHGMSDLLVRLDQIHDAEASRFSPALRDRGIDPMAARRVVQARDDLLRVARRWGEGWGGDPADDETLLRLILVAFPDRVCRRRPSDPGAGLMVGGRGVRLGPESVVREGDLFLAIDPRDDRGGSSGEAIVRIASLIRAEWLDAAFPGSVRREKSARFDEGRGRIVGVHTVRYRDLVIEEGDGVAVDPELAARVLADAIIPRGRGFVLEHEEAAAWVARFDLVRRAMPEAGLPPIDEAAVAGLVTEACRGRRSLEELRRAPWVDLLRGLLTYPQARFVDEAAPESIAVPSGSRVRLRYEADRPPVLAVRLQELFGWAETPRVAGGRVPVVLHLLGPNYRPVQITDDLGSFWADAYFQVRKDLRNRYPRHAWPENPLEAKPEARGGRKLG